MLFFFENFINCDRLESFFLVEYKSKFHRKEACTFKNHQKNVTLEARKSKIFSWVALLILHRGLQYNKKFQWHKHFCVKLALTTSDFPKQRFFSFFFQKLSYLSTYSKSPQPVHDVLIFKRRTYSARTNESACPRQFTIGLEEEPAGGWRHGKPNYDQVIAKWKRQKESKVLDRKEF